jgi:hypothetical protein
VLPGQPIDQLVNGTRYPDTFLSGEVFVRAVPFIAPPINGDDMSWSTPFEMRGQISGFADFLGRVPLFSVPVTGGGTASVYATVFGDQYVGQGVFFRFQAASPTPEPTSVFLLTAGLLGFYARSRLRRRDGL